MERVGGVWLQGCKGMCVALENISKYDGGGEIGWVGEARPGRDCKWETIHVEESTGMIQVLVEVARRQASF